MAIKAGQIVHIGNGQTLIDRIQSGGPGQVNIATSKIDELGNYKSVATVRETPDLTFTLESLDVSREIEAMLTRSYAGRSVTTGAMTATEDTLTAVGAAFTSADVGRTVTVVGAGTAGGLLVTTIASVTNATTVVLDDSAATTVADAKVSVNQAGGINLADAVPGDYSGQFKAGRDKADPTKVVASVALPFLNLESFSYRFGLRDNATKTATLRGDSIFYNPGPTHVEEVAGSGTAGQTIVTAHPAYQLAEGTEPRILAVTAANQRLVLGPDYTEAYGAVSGGAATTTITLVAAVPVDEIIRIVYSSPDLVQYPQTVHEDATVKPAAVRGRDIEIYVGGYDPDDVAGSQANKLPSVQSINVDWRQTLEKDEEFGNYYAVAQEPTDVPTVNGSVDIKPRDVEQLMTLVRKTQGQADALKVMGANTAIPLDLDIVIKNPDTGQTEERIHVPSARFTAPGYTGRVTQKTTVSLPFESDEGELILFDR